MRVVPVTPSDEKLLRSAERVHRQLRPHIGDYFPRMKEILGAGAEMAVAIEGEEVRGLTVFRILEKTHSGRDLYCDDLVTDEGRRSTGVGHVLMEYMERIARERGCDTFSLDSGTQRHHAHRLYLGSGYVIPALHFSKAL